MVVDVGVVVGAAQQCAEPVDLSGADHREVVTGAEQDAQGFAVASPGLNQQIISAYAHPDPREGKTLLARVIDVLRTAVPAGLDELATLGRPLQRRRADVLAYFAHRASNGPTEAINARLEALRRNCLGFRNLINYRIRSLLHCGALAL